MTICEKPVGNTLNAAKRDLVWPWTVYAIVEFARYQSRVRYIGRTTKPIAVRLQQHMNSHVGSELRECLSYGRIAILPLEENLEYGLACQAEADWMATFPGYLMNVARPQALLIKKRPPLRKLADRRGVYLS